MVYIAAHTMALMATHTRACIAVNLHTESSMISAATRFNLLHWQRLLDIGQAQDINICSLDLLCITTTTTNLFKCAPDGSCAILNTAQYAGQEMHHHLLRTQPRFKIQALTQGRCPNCWYNCIPSYGLRTAICLQNRSDADVQMLWPLYSIVERACRQCTHHRHALPLGNREAALHFMLNKGSLLFQQASVYQIDGKGKNKESQEGLHSSVHFQRLAPTFALKSKSNCTCSAPKCTL